MASGYKHLSRYVDIHGWDRPGGQQLMEVDGRYAIVPAGIEISVKGHDIVFSTKTKFGSHVEYTGRFLDEIIEAFTNIVVVRAKADRLYRYIPLKPSTKIRLPDGSPVPAGVRIRKRTKTKPMSVEYRDPIRAQWVTLAVGGSGDEEYLNHVRMAAERYEALCGRLNHPPLTVAQVTKLYATKPEGFS